MHTAFTEPPHQPEERGEEHHKGEIPTPPSPCSDNPRQGNARERKERSAPPLPRPARRAGGRTGDKELFAQEKPAVTGVRNAHMRNCIVLRHPCTVPSLGKISAAHTHVLVARRQSALAVYQCPSNANS